MIGIINASPLIYLGKIGAISLLPKLFSECYTTSFVKKEVLSNKNAPEIPALEECFSSWLSLKEPSNEQLIERLGKLNIHLGEASVITLAKELQDKSDKSIRVIDDLAAREIARTLDLKVTGTIGIFINAFRLKFIDVVKCKEYLNILVEHTTFRISSALYSKILKEIEKIDETQKI